MSQREVVSVSRENAIQEARGNHEDDVRRFARLLDHQTTWQNYCISQNVNVTIPLSRLHFECHDIGHFREFRPSLVQKYIRELRLEGMPKEPVHVMVVELPLTGDLVS